MKSLHKNKLVSIHPKINLEEEDYGIGEVFDSNGNYVGQVDIYGFTYYEYRNNPLYFIKTSDLNSTQKIQIISLFDKWYAETNQDTTDWSLEFQLVTRMILDNALVINPLHLELGDEELSILMDIL